jgi:hypothetical protein
MTAVPEALAASKSFTFLKVELNPGLADCQHLTALTLLRQLSLRDCHLQAVPSALSTLTALTSLNMCLQTTFRMGGSTWSR